jgi:hypothetical protein
MGVRGCGHRHGVRDLGGEDQGRGNWYDMDKRTGFVDITRLSRLRDKLDRDAVTRRARGSLDIHLTELGSCVNKTRGHSFGHKLKNETRQEV